MPRGYPSNGPKSNGATTKTGRLTIVKVNTTNGAQCFSPVLPGETEDEWLTHLSGIRASLQPANYHEEELCRNIALTYWQARRVYTYERAKLRQQMDEEPSFSGGTEMAEVIEAGVDSMKAQIAQCRRVLELIGLERDAADTESIDATDGRLLLRYVVTLATRGKLTLESEAFPDLPQGEWTWATVRSHLVELAEASGKSVQSILRALHAETLERYDTTRTTLEKGLCTLQANYVLHQGGMELQVHYHDRIANRVTKWLALFGQAKADRLGLFSMRPDDGGNGETGDDIG